MNYFNYIIAFFTYIKNLLDGAARKRDEKRRKEETKKVADFKKDVEKSVVDGNVADLNEKLKF